MWRLYIWTCAGFCLHSFSVCERAGGAGRETHGLFSLSAAASVVSCSSAQYSSTIWMSLFGICFPQFRQDFRCVLDYRVWFSYGRVAQSVVEPRRFLLPRWKLLQKSHSMIFSSNIDRSVLMSSISILLVMECMPCSLVLMATSVMDPHCIAAKSWLNNLPLLWLERLSQLFNDVSVLEGGDEHTPFYTHTHAHIHTHRLTNGLRHTHSRTERRRRALAHAKRKASVSSWTAELASRGRKRRHRDGRHRRQRTEA